MFSKDSTHLDQVSTNDFIRPPGSIRSWILDQVAAHKPWRYANDPEYRKRRIELSSEWRLNRRKTDPEWRAKRTTYYEEQHHRRRNHLRTWLRQDSQARQLTWPEHSCVFYEERTIHVCCTCAQRLNRNFGGSARKDTITPMLVSTRSKEVPTGRLFLDSTTVICVSRKTGLEHYP